jgi:phage FluMu protein Com
MPIRFRCVYCNQLLSIARRKAGAIVRCTKCEGQIIVPDANPAATELAGDEPPKLRGGAKRPSDAGSLFERDDFEAILEPYQKPAMPAAVADPPSPSAHRERLAFNSASPSPAPAPATIALTRRQMAVAFALIVLGVGMSFALGLWLGKSMG